MHKLLLIHPCVRSYRVDFFNKLAENFSVSLVETGSPAKGGHSWEDRKDSLTRLNHIKLISQSRFKLPKLRNSNLSLFYALLNPTKYDYIIYSSFTSLPFLLTWWWVKVFGVKLIVLEEMWIYPNTTRYRFLESFFKRIVYLSVDFFLCMSSKSKRFVDCFFDKKVEACSIINCHASTPMQNEISHIPKAANRFNDSILYLSRVEQIKGLDILIKAIANTSLSLDVYGDGAYLDYCIRLTKSLGLENRVSFYGACKSDQVDSIMRKYRYFVLPSRFVENATPQVESWGFVVNEALSNGCAVIVSSMVGGSEDLIKDGANGFVFASESHVCLAEKIRSLKMLDYDPLSIATDFYESCNNIRNVDLIKDFLKV